VRVPGRCGAYARPAGAAGRAVVDSARPACLPGVGPGGRARARHPGLRGVDRRGAAAGVGLQGYRHDLHPAHLRGVVYRRGFNLVAAAASRPTRRRKWNPNWQGNRMTGWRDRWAGALPRLAVVLHDLGMVWLVWQGLHWLRFGVMANPPPMPLWSTEVGLVLA